MGPSRFSPRGVAAVRFSSSRLERPRQFSPRGPERRRRKRSCRRAQGRVRRALRLDAGHQPHRGLTRAHRAVTIDRGFLLKVAVRPRCPGDPAITDWGAIAAAAARHSEELMDQRVYEQPHDRARRRSSKPSSASPHSSTATSCSPALSYRRTCCACRAPFPRRTPSPWWNAPPAANSACSRSPSTFAAISSWAIWNTLSSPLAVRSTRVTASFVETVHGRPQAVRNAAATALANSSLLCSSAGMRTRVWKSAAAGGRAVPRRPAGP